MATKRYRKSNKSKEITYQDIKDLKTPEDLNKYFWGGDVVGVGTSTHPDMQQSGTASTLNNTSQKSGIGSAAGSIPIIGAFAKVGNSLGQAFNQRDENGIAQSSTGAQAVGNFFDPVTLGQDLAKEGRYGEAALSILTPGIGSTIFGKRLNERKEDALRKRQMAERAYSVGMQKVQDSYTNNPIYSSTMRYGGNLQKMAVGGKVKSYLTTSSGEREISPDEVESVKKYLAYQKRLNDYYSGKYKTRISNLNKLGITTPEAYEAHIAKNPSDILESEDYKELYKGSKFTPEEIAEYEPLRDKYFSVGQVKGTKEDIKDRVTNTAFGGRNLFAGLNLGFKQIPEEVPPQQVNTSPYSYEPYRGYSGISIGYSMDKPGGTRTPSVFRSSTGQEVAIDPKRGMVPTAYPELTREFQNISQKQYGGTINYNGQYHEGPDGGVPVDGMGNPNSINPVALVEKGEVSYNTPDGGTYIYSDTLKHDKNKTFAKKAKDVQRRYKFRMKDGVINDPFAKKSYDNEMLGLMDNQEELRDFQNMQKESLRVKKYGGDLPMYLGGSTLPPLVKPVDNTADMDEFVNQVEMDYPSRIQPNFNLNTSPVLPKASQVKSDIINTQGVHTTKPELYQGMNWAETGLAAAVPVISGLTGMLLDKYNRPKLNKLRLDRMTPQQISLERRRRAAREGAGVASANLSRALKGASPTSGSYMSNVIAGITDIDRNLSNQLGESYTQEEIQNAQLRQQADAANLDISMQENMYNNQAEYMDAAQRNALRNAYLSQIGQGVTSALNQKFQSSRDADYLNMLNPNYELGVTGRGLNRKRYYRPRT